MGLLQTSLLAQVVFKAWRDFWIGAGRESTIEIWRTRLSQCSQQLAASHIRQLEAWIAQSVFGAWRHRTSQRIDRRHKLATTFQPIVRSVHAESQRLRRRWASSAKGDQAQASQLKQNVALMA